MLSIIVPVYNGEKYLKRCLNSIQNQTYKDFEAIIIDDGSTDGSGRICDQISMNDPRFHIIYQKHAGVAAARNSGLSQAQGEYIAFIDSDDYVDPNYLEILMRGMDHPKVDISYCAAQNEDENQNIIPNKEVINDVIFAASDYEWNGPLQHPIVWGAIFRRKTIEGINFDIRFSVAEDSLFFAQSLKRAKMLCFKHDKVYHYVIYKESAAHGKFSEKKLTELKAWKEICNLYQDDPHYDSVVGAYIIRLIMFCRKYYQEGEFRTKFLNELISEYHRNQKKYLKFLRKTKRARSLMAGIAFGVCPKLYLQLRHY